MNKFEEIKNKVAEMEADAEKFYIKKNKAAGTRVRAGLLEIKALAAAGRNEVSDLKGEIDAANAIG